MPQRFIGQSRASVVWVLAAGDVRDGAVVTVGLVVDVLSIGCQNGPGVLGRG
jgi:hypothetical protein